jgi:tetratricopeptide (TPR) repeat protein
LPILFCQRRAKLLNLPGAMHARPRIFISAVSNELGKARQLVINVLQRLGYETESQEIFGTEQGDLRDMLRRKIDSCEGLIQLTGQRFGFSPTKPEEDPHAVSYTQFELHYARERGKKVWPIILDEKFPSDADNDEPECRCELQKAYRKNLCNCEHLYHRAKNFDELKIRIFELNDQLAELRIAWEKEQRRARRFRVFAGVGILVLVGLVLAVAKMVSGVKSDTGSIKKDVAQIKDDTARKKALVTEYVQLRIVIMAAGEKEDDTVRNSVILAELEKKHGLPSGTLERELPETAKKLAADITATKFERAKGAFAVRDFAEAERFALEAASEAAKTVPPDRQKIIHAFEVAGWSALQRREDTNAIKHFTAASALTDKTGNPVEWANVQHALACALYAHGEYAEAENLYRQIILTRTDKLGPTNVNTLASRNNLGFTLLEESKYAEAEAELRDVVRLMQSVHGPEHPETLASRHNLGNALFAQKKYAEAEAEHRATFQLFERVRGPEHPSTLRSRSSWAMALYGLDRFTKAEAEHRAVLRIRERVLPRDHPETLDSRNNIALILNKQGKYPEAEAEHRAVLQARERVLGPEHSKTLDSRNNLAGTLYKQRKFAEAEAEYRTALSLRERLQGPGHSETLNTRNNLAATLAAEGKHAEAEAEHRLVLKAMEGLHGPENSNTLDSRLNLAIALQGQGKNAEAETEYRAVLGLRERVSGPEHRDTLVVLYNLAYFLNKQSRAPDALPFAQRAVEGARKKWPASDPNRKAFERLYEQLTAKK